MSMISEGSYETQDWSNDAENSALHHRNKLHFKIYSVPFYFKVLDNSSQLSMTFASINF